MAIRCLFPLLALAMLAWYPAAAQNNDPSPNNDSAMAVAASAPTLIPIDTLRFGSKLTAIAGGAFPMGEYAETTGVRPGFATPGFSAGIEYTVHADSFALLVSPGWVSTLLVSANGSDQSGVKAALAQEFNIPPDANPIVEAGPWVTASVLTGFEGNYQLANNWSIGVQSQFGFVVGSSSLVRLASERGAITQHSSIAAAPCFSVGVVSSFWNRFALAMRYYRSTITYDIRTINPDGTSSALYYDQPSDLLSLYLGYTFATFRHQTPLFAEEVVEE